MWPELEVNYFLCTNIVESGEIYKGPRWGCSEGLRTSAISQSPEGWEEPED
jgi:hypothetical protein